MRIHVHAKGGLSVYGGHYDPRTNEATFLAREGDGVALTIEYPSAASAASIETSGLTASAASVTGSVLTATLTDIVSGGYADVIATFGGTVRTVRVVAGCSPESEAYPSS
jgi:hypothetical protein